MTIQMIIKKALKRLELEGKLLTPDFYAEAFCKEATKAGMQVEDCNHLEKFTQSLGKDFQKDLKNYRISTMHELVRFLISKLNRTNATTCSQTLEAQTFLLKRILQTISILHNKEASELAAKSLDMIENTPSADQLDNFRQLWSNFLTTYDDTFLEQLKSLGDVDTLDLRGTIEKLHFGAAEVSSGGDINLTKIASLLVASFVPSIASSVNDKIATISEKIRKHPEVLETNGIESDIKTAILLRIALDKKSVKEMVESLDGVLDKLSGRLIEMIENSDASNAEVKKIKSELESYNELPPTNFKVAHKKLYTIAVALEKNTQLLSHDLQEHSQEVALMSKKIKKLEKELEEAKKETKQDFLTKLLNRRGLDEVLNVKEAEYKRHIRNYTVVMFDLDHFKRVNDTYGHEAGDAVLAAFAKILKQEARVDDTVGRYGGEEFLAVLSETDKEGGVTFAEKVRSHVRKSRFMFKGERIKLTVSSGVAQRKTSFSLEDVVKQADDNLYKAKNSGRDKVVS